MTLRIQPLFSAFPYWNIIFSIVRSFLSAQSFHPRFAQVQSFLLLFKKLSLLKSLFKSQFYNNIFLSVIKYFAYNILHYVTLYCKLIYYFVITKIASSAKKLENRLYCTAVLLCAFVVYMPSRILILCLSANS